MNPTELVSLVQIVVCGAAAAFHLAFSVPIAIRHARGATITRFQWVVLAASALPLLFSVWVFSPMPNEEVPGNPGPSIVEGQ